MTNESSEKEEFPSRTCRGKLKDPVNLNKDINLQGSEIINIEIVDNKFFAIRQTAITGHETELGNLLSVWPKTAISKPQTLFPAPVFCSDIDNTNSIPVGIDPERGDLCWLYPQNLQAKQCLALADIELQNLDKENRKAAFLRASKNNTILLMLTGTHKNNKQHVVVELDLNAKLISTWSIDNSNDLLKKTPDDLALVSDGLLVLSGTKLELLEKDNQDSQSASLELGQAANRIWPSPSGKYVLVTANNRPMFQLCEISSDKTKPLTQILEGMHLPKTDKHPEGWQFWDIQAPNIDDPDKFKNPMVCWSENSDFAVLGDSQGLSCLINPLEAKAVKLMTPPDKAFLPFLIKNPDSIYFLSSNQNLQNEQSPNVGQVARLELDWIFASESCEQQEQKNMDENLQTETDEHALESEEKPVSERPKWLLPTMAIAAILALLLIWYQSNS